MSWWSALNSCRTVVTSLKPLNLPWLLCSGALNNRWSDSVNVIPYQYIDVNCTKPLGNCGYKFEAVKSSMTALFRCTTQPKRPASVIDIPYQDVVVKCTKRLRNCRYKFEAVVAMDLCINALEVLNDLVNLKLPPGEKLAGLYSALWFIPVQVNKESVNWDAKNFCCYMSVYCLVFSREQSQYSKWLSTETGKAPGIF